MFPSTTTAAALLSLAAFASAHCTVLDVLGSNNVVGHGWGVNTEGKFPRSGNGGDAGADSTKFGTSDSPNPACGATSELGALDPTSYLANSVNLPAAYSNGSVVLTVFQVDADGGGPMECEVNKDGTLAAFQEMTMNLNMAGNFGIFQNSNRVNSTVVTTFPSGTTCTGGPNKDACVVRCRAGVDKNFGSCFSVKLASEKFVSKVTLHASINPSNGNSKREVDVEEREWDEDAAEIELTTRALFERAGTSISKSQLSQIVNQVVKKMKSSGLVVKQAMAKRDLAQQISDALTAVAADQADEE